MSMKITILLTAIGSLAGFAYASFELVVDPSNCFRSHQQQVHLRSCRCIRWFSHCITGKLKFKEKNK